MSRRRKRIWCYLFIHDGFSIPLPVPTCKWCGAKGGYAFEPPTEGFM